MLLVFATAALVAVAIGQAILFLFQLRIMGSGLEDTKNAADAALRSAKTAEGSARAYVFMGLHRTINHLDTGVREGVLQLNNAGLSMGVVGRICAYFVAEIPTAETPTFDAPTEKNSVYLDFVIPPKSSSVPIEIFRPIIPDRFDPPFILVGYVEYVDIYRAPHVSYFCCKMEKLDISGPSNGPGGKILPVGSPAWNSWT